MDICGEHGADIAFTGRDCPACEQIDDINRDHNTAIDDLTSEFESDMNAMQDTIDELQEKLEDAK